MLRFASHMVSHYSGPDPWAQDLGDLDADVLEFLDEEEGPTKGDTSSQSFRPEDPVVPHLAHISILSLLSMSNAGLREVSLPFRVAASIGTASVTGAVLVLCHDSYSGLALATAPMCNVLCGEPLCVISRPSDPRNVIYDPMRIEEKTNEAQASAQRAPPIARKDVAPCPVP